LKIKALALVFFKKETIGGKTLKKCLKIGIYDNLYIKVRSRTEIKYKVLLKRDKNKV
jgi:hypothetical protein